MCGWLLNTHVFHPEGTPHRLKLTSRPAPTQSCCPNCFSTAHQLKASVAPHLFLPSGLSNSGPCLGLQSSAGS